MGRRRSAGLREEKSGDTIPNKEAAEGVVFPSAVKKNPVALGFRIQA